MPGLPFGELERLLKALANENRLRLLQDLQTPKGYRDLRLHPGRSDHWGTEDRSVTRPAIRHHLAPLLEMGVVVESPTRNGEAQFVVNHARLFGVVEQLRQLSTVRAVVDVPSETLPFDADDPGPQDSGPHLVLVRGVHEGRAFRLDAATKARWSIGRGRQHGVCLDYDPYVSNEHAQILAKEGRYFLVDLPDNRNGTYLNWRRMIRGGTAPLKGGDIIGVGMSLLVFRE